ncbi:MAG: MotA/TolQ/ExbB proton channel family protein [Proteobacteria bacterium]|nr:MotA/TolQ/ExbB proton channel family protein [Pseudomonadota bacterium]
MSLDGIEFVTLPGWFFQLGLMGPPLAICSLFALAIGLERLVFVIRSLLRSRSELQHLMDTLHENRGQPKAVRDELVGLMLNEMRRPYFSGLKILRMIGTISPIFGLLGTILGIIAAFQVIAVQTGPVSPALIADGLWEAMLTTAVGLLIALPALIIAHIMGGFSERRLEGYCLELNRLSLTLEMEQEPQSSDIIELSAGARRQ